MNIGEKFGLLELLHYKKSSNGYRGQFRCECGNVCEYILSRVTRGSQKSCGKCNFKSLRLKETKRADLIGMKFGYLIVTEYIKTIRWGKAYHAVWRCKCDCGNLIEVTTGRLKSGNTKSCGCFAKKRRIETWRKVLDGQIFGELTVIKYSHTIGKSAYSFCLCSCGKECTKKHSQLLSGKCRTCGHCDEPNIGDRFYNLEICDIIRSLTSGCSVKCLCSCGRKIKDKWYKVKSGERKSCGKCFQYRNGQRCSFTQIALAQQITNIIDKPAVINFKSKSNYIDIAFELKGQKIAIEYDSWFIHHSLKKQKQDKKRVKLLTKRGWKVLVIKSDGLLPNAVELNQYINELRYNDTDSKIVIMSDWGKGKKSNWYPDKEST